MSDDDANPPAPMLRASPRLAAKRANNAAASGAAQGGAANNLPPANANAAASGPRRGFRGRSSPRPPANAAASGAAVNANVASLPRPGSRLAVNANAAASGAAQGGAANDNRRAIPPRHPGGGASVSFPTLSPIQLGPPPGPREVVDHGKAMNIVKIWKEQLSEHLAKIRAAVLLNDDDDAGNYFNANHPQQIILCDRIHLSGKSYTAKAAQVIASFLNKPLFDGVPPLAHGIVEAYLIHVIASLKTEEGLLTLKTLCGAFANSSNLKEVDLSENAIGEQAIDNCKTVLSLKSLERLSLNNTGLAENTMAKVANILTSDEDGTGCVASNLTKLHFSRNMSDFEG